MRKFDALYDSTPKVIVKEEGEDYWKVYTSVTSVDVAQQVASALNKQEQYAD